jgi:hypothetical protein
LGGKKTKPIYPLGNKANFRKENGTVENGEIFNVSWETNRNDVNIFRRLKFSVNSWYFAGN